jgi:GMP synthase-like glutamine amidotransferase
MSHVKSDVVLMHQHAQELQNMPKGEVKQNWVGQSWMGICLGSSLMAQELGRLQRFW